jgi:SecD/SecF fusion protein
LALGPEVLNLQSRNIWFLVLVVVLTAASVFGYMNKPLKKGLDVAGGIRLTMQIDPATITPEQRKNLSRLQNQVQDNLERRISQGLGLNEATVTTKGDTGFVIEMPGATDLEQAKSLLKSTAKVQLFHAKNVATSKRPNKLYSTAQQLTDENGAPYTTFTRVSNPNVELKPGDPAYKAMIDGWDLLIEGDDISDAYGETLGPGKARPQFKFSSEGSQIMSAWSRKYLNEGENIAFVMDDRVLQISPKNDGAILSGGAYIEGEFDAKYVKELTGMIKSGSIPVSLTVEASEKVSPTIGEKAFNQMVTAGVISFVIIVIYLVAYYSFPGVVAAIAMTLYCLFTITVMKYAGATFSLASLAAFILSVGMAVDANILVFERVKEELRAGRKLSTAIELGFKRALSAIFDSNACTVITSTVLFVLGTAAVKGFATALVIGVLVSFFTAVTVTRSLLVGLTSIGIGNDVKWYALNRNLFGEKLEAGASEKTLKVISKYKRYFMISACLIIPGLIALGMNGIKPNVEFQGGFEASYAVDNTITSKTILDSLEKNGIKGANVKFASVGNTREAYVTIPSNNPVVKTNDPEAISKIATAAGLTADAKSGISEVGPSVRAETTTNAIKGILYASGLIVLYIALRFGFALGGMKNGIKFGMSAVLALLHDVVFVIGSAAIVGLLFGWEVSSMFITAMLTVIGFSVHDTIIIFDRIRENLKRSRGAETFEHLCDISVTQTIARSINTSSTAMLPLVLLLIFGTPTPDLKFMVLVMFLGIAVGTYSSIFNASPILWLWDKAIVKKKGEAEGLVSEAQRESKLRAAQIVAAPVTAGEVDASAYGTIKRKQSVREQASHSIDDDED